MLKNPGAEYRGLPFWSWNCKLDKETVDEQLAIFKEMGFGGVVIHPREGLDSEYLGEEFMDVVKHTVEKCREMGMICWLYDDDRFPSGAADGIVTKNPRYRARELRLTSQQLGEGYFNNYTEFEKAIDNGEIPKGYYCCAYAIEIKDKLLKSYRRLAEDEIVQAVANGEDVRYAYVELYPEKEWFQNQTYSDTMNPAAVDEFIKVTHERYKETLGKDFGDTAQAIFTDEPRLGKQPLLQCADTKEDGFVPYTEYFAERFTEKYGKDSLDVIPEYLWDRADGDLHNRYIYHEMATECFSQAFMDRICAWCKNNGILMTGHILGEEKLTSQATTVGDAMRTYKDMDIPGVDILIDAREYSTVKQAASVAAQYGRKYVMSELYGVTNWDCTFKTYKLQGDWQAALGITRRIPHLSHMSLKGEAKRDWPASIFYQSPWYKEYPYIEDYFARLNSVLTKGKRITKIAVVHPVESMWISFGPQDVTNDIRVKLDKDFRKLQEWLLYNTLDFDYLSEALLEHQEVSCNGKLCVGAAAYDVVIVPEMLTIRQNTLAILNQFATNGGKIIFMGEVPGRVGGSESVLPAELAKKCVRIANDESELLDSLEYLRDVEIKDENGSYSDNLLYQLREDEEGKWLFICHANPSATESESYKIRIKGECQLTAYDAMDGKCYAMVSTAQNGYTELEWRCHSEDSVLLKLSSASDGEKYHEEKEYETVQAIEKIASFKRSEPNVLLLDTVRFSVDGSDVSESEEMLRADNKIRALLGFSHRTGEDMQPWAMEEKENHSLTLYCDIYSEIDTVAMLGIENAQKCRIYLNGEIVNNQPIGYYVDKAIDTINLGEIKKGTNELRIEMDYNNKSIIENMYVLGEFGVRLDGRKATIVEKSDVLEFGDITKQGMPFYTGNLEYEFEIEIETEEEYFLRIPEFVAPLIAVYTDGEKNGLVAYNPHRISLGKLKEGIHKIKAVMYGNRFNGFGVLHNANENYVWYGNGSYRTTGDNWTYDYMLRPVAIMENIILEKEHH